MNFSTTSHVSFVYNIYLVASVVVCVCFVCYYSHCCNSLYNYDSNYLVCYMLS